VVDKRDGTVNGDNREYAHSPEGGDAATTPYLIEHEADATSQEAHASRDAAGDLTAVEITEQAEDPYEGAVPPGYDWPTHGGYLGCLMGVVAATIVAMFLTAPVLYFADIPLAVVWLLRVVIFLLCIFGGGRLGWWLGKRFYREYPHERPTWGESDDAEVEGDVTEDKDSAGETSTKA
jgi:hypothetical protein